MIAIELKEVAFDVAHGRDEDGNVIKVLMLVDPQSGIQVVVPFSAEGSAKLMQKLTGIEVPAMAVPRGKPH